MRRYLATSAAALAAAIASLGACAGAAFAASPAGATAWAASSTSTAPSSPTAAAKPGKNPTTPSSTVAPVAVRASGRLYLPDAFFVRSHAVIVPGRTIHVAGFVRPYVANQWVEVKTYLGHKLIKTDQLRIRPSTSGRSGSFTEKVKSPGIGLLTVTANHRRTPQMKGFLAQRRVAALRASAGFGSGGEFVALIQQRLAAVHVYVPQTGVYDQQTGLALDAYHRLLGHGTSQSLDGATTSELLNGVGSFKVRYPHDGTHVEGNLGKQLLALIHGSKVDRIYPISSGKPSTPTVLGHFRVYSRTPGYLPDGMYYSDFFYGGYAIHGYDPAPDYPASHGCMRLPIVDAISVFSWLTFGDIVDVYY